MKHTRKFLVALVIVMTLLMTLVTIPASAAEPTVTIKGSFDGWGNGLSLPVVSTNIHRATIELEAGTYEFKVMEGSTWMGNGGTIEDTTVNTSATGWKFSTNDGSNCKLKATGGTYIFEYNSSTDNLFVYAPTRVAGSAELCGSSWDAADNDNLMSYDGSKFVKTYEGVAAGSYELKVALGSWSIAYPSSNKAITVEKNNSTVTVTFTPSSQSVAVSVEHIHIEDEGTVTTQPGCESTGTTTYKCAVEGCTDVVRTETVDALGHSFSNGTCSACGAEDPDYVAPVTNHTATIDYTTYADKASLDGVVKTDGEITIVMNKNTGSTAPTYYTNGSAARVYGGNTVTISVSDGYEIVSIVVNANSSNYLKDGNHSITNGDVTSGLNSKAVTITPKDGTNSVIITNSGSSGNIRFSSIDVVYRAASGTSACEHTNTTTTTVDATCTETGSKKVECDDCGEIVSSSVIDALGHSDEDGDFKCDRDCGTVVPPAADSVLTIEQALALGALYTKDNYTSDKYYITGVITSISNTTYGNMNIEDENGNSILIYGLYSADGSIRYDAMETKPVAGDTITVYGIIGYYSAAQMKDGWMTKHIIAECDHVDADGDYICDNDGCGVVVPPAADSVLTIEQALALGALTTTTDKYYLSGTITGFYGNSATTYGNVYIADENGNSILIYGLYSADGSIRYDAMETKPVVGDAITVYGIMTSYNGVGQMKNGYMTAYTAHTHDYSSEVTTEATCTEAGVTTYTCSICSGSYTEAIDAPGHSWVDADCDTPKTCSVCQATEGEALGHNYVNGVCSCGEVDPACVAQIGAVYYYTLSDAIAAVNDGDTVILHADVDSMPSINKAITIKGAGETPGIKVNCAIAENFPGIDGTVTFENLIFNNRISTENASTDQSKLTLEFDGCVFNIPAGNTYAIQAGSSWNNDVLGALVIDNCEFNTTATSFVKGYMVYAQCAESVTITNSAFNGGNVYRGAVHLGDSTVYATVATISNNEISNTARGIQIGNRVDGTLVTIEENTINVAPIDGETESAALYIHEVANVETTDVQMNYNEIGDSLAVFSENTTGPVPEFVSSFNGNTVEGTVIPLEGNYVDSAYVASVYVATINGVGYETLADALAAASTMTGDVVVEINDKVTLSSSLSGSYDSITFVGKDTDAEIYLDVQGFITASGKTVNFENLTLSKSAGDFITDAGFMNVAFGVYNVKAVNYTNCTFSNGSYASSGVVTYTGCTFYRSHSKYGLWAYGDADIFVETCTFADDRGIKMYAEGAAKVTNLTVKNTDFSALNDKPAIVLTYGESVTLEGNTYSSTGVFELDLGGAPNGTPVTSDKPAEIICNNDDGACGVLVDGKIYTTVAQAAEVATAGSTVTLLHNSSETVELAEGVILDKNGYTADGVTVKVFAPAGNIQIAYITTNYNNSGRNGLFGEAVGVEAKESFVVYIYSGDTLVGTSALVDTDKVLLNGQTQTISWHILIGEDTDSWWSTEWVGGALNVNAIPDKVELYVDGVKVSEGAVKLNSSDDSYPIIAAVTDANGNVQNFVAADGYLNNLKNVATNINTAIENAEDGSTLVLLRDLALDGTVKVLADNSITLDLNGKTMDGTGNVNIALMSYGDLTVKDSSAEQSGVIKAGIGTSGNAVNICGGTFTLESGSIYSLNNAILIDEETAIININGGKITAEPTTRNSAAFYISSTSDTVVDITDGEIVGYNGVLLWNNTTLNISGGSIDAQGSVAIQGNGSKDNTEINISGDETVIKGYYAAIYHPQGGDLNISGGTLSGWSGIVVKGGNINISGGNINGTGAANAYKPVSSGFVDTGDALYVEHYDNSTSSENYGTPVVTITGGTFISANAQAVGNYVNSNNSIEALKDYISGGTFGNSIDEALISEGYMVAQNGTEYVVVNDPAYGKVAMIGSTYYETLKEAIEASVDGDTITLVADVTLTDLIKVSGKSFTLDGDGHVVTGTGALWLLSGTYSIDNVIFDDITYTNGYGILEFTYATATITGCTFSNNVANNCIAVDCNANNDGNSNVTIEGCTITANECSTSVINSAEGSTTVKNSVITNNIANIAVVYNSASFNANGCYFSDNTLTGTNANKAVILTGPWVEGNYTVSITDNAFLDEYVALYVENWISGINNTIDGNYWRDGDKPVAGTDYVVDAGATAIVYDYCTTYSYENGVLTLGGKESITYVAQIGNAKYETLDAAIAAANDGDTITLLADVSADALEIGKSVTIDGAGYAITAAISITADNANITIDNANIVGIAGNSAVISILANADLTVKNSTITAIGDNQFILLADGVSSASAYVDAELTLVNGEVLSADADDISASFRAEYADELAARGYVTKSAADGMVSVSGSVPYYIGADGYWYFNGEKTEYKAVGTDGNSFTIGEDGYWYLNGEKTEYKAVATDADQYTIGEDGYWYLNGTKTEYKALGQDGNNYTIGDDGYWYLNGEKTEYKAVGTDGAKVEIGDDGYWYINDVKTEYKAVGEDGKTPTFKIEDGKLYVSCDEGNSWTDLGQVVGANGEVPSISENGNWVIGGVETNYPAIGKDGKNYTIGTDGYWYIDGEKTEYRAIGVDGKTPTFKIDAGNLFVSYDDGATWTDLGRVVGQDGITPHIGENGNWWIGEKDTGVPAKGQNGKAPFIGENGNWWIGEEDTGIQARGEDGNSNQEIILICIGIAALCIITTIVAVATRKYRYRWWILT